MRSLTGLLKDKKKERLLVLMTLNKMCGSRFTQFLFSLFQNLNLESIELSKIFRINTENFPVLMTIFSLKMFHYLMYRSLNWHLLFTRVEKEHMFTRDLDQAYYLLPLNPSEYPLMCFKWAGKLYF